MRDAVAGVVLAAGAGSRFGGTKQLARLEGRPLVAHVVATAVEAGLEPVLVVVGHDAEAVTAAVGGTARIVVNPGHDEGQASSLRAAVGTLSTGPEDGLVVLLADEPGVTVAAVEAVRAALVDGAEVARAVYDDRPGHPVGLARSVWPDVLGVRGDEGARQLFDRLDVTSVPITGSAPVDVDTPADLDTLS